MDFSLSMEQKILRDSVRAFAEKEIGPVARTLDETERFSYELIKPMAELGLFGIFVSEQYSGQDLDHLSYIIGVEELARVDASQAANVAPANSLGIGPVYYFGTKEQKRKYLPGLCNGEASFKHQHLAL
jgi:short/branched chain acyl-CoA dehydrogenase